MFTPRFMKFATVSFASAFLFTLNGCTNKYNGVESVHTPTIAKQQFSHEIRFNEDDSLSNEQKAQLEGFLHATQPAYGDFIAIDDPTTGGAQARRDIITNMIAQRGLKVTPSLVMTSQILPAQTVRLVIEKRSASLEECPNWSQTHFDESLNTPMSPNYGCATRGNMAAMIADPSEWEAGKAYEGPDGQTIAKGIKAWRDADATSKQGLQSTSAAALSSGGGQ
jgi:pilus assembly protein CpaD